MALILAAAGADRGRRAREGDEKLFGGRRPIPTQAAYRAAAAGLPVPNTMTFAPIGVRL